MSNYDYVKVRYEERLKETDKAVLVRIKNREIWLPLSQIEDSGVIDRPPGRVLYARRWLCDENEVPYV